MPNNDPRYIKLKNGDLIDTNTGRLVVSTEINNAFAINTVSPQGRDGLSYTGGRRRYIDDLPLPAPNSRAVAVIASYSIFGLEAIDIADILNTSTENVQAVLDSKEYGEFVECMLQNIREYDADQVRKLINKEAFNAATNVKTLMDSNDEKIKLAASKDILDRREKLSDQLTGRGNDGNTLTIRIIANEKVASDNITVDIEQ